MHMLLQMQLGIPYNSHVHSKDLHILHKDHITCVPVWPRC